MSRVILYFLRQPFSLFTACSTRHCGTSACCLRWRWEGSLLCLRVGFNFLYVVPQAGGQRAFLVIFDVVCYVVRTSFGTSFFPGPIGCLWITDGRAKPLMNRKVVDISSLQKIYLSSVQSFLCGGEQVGRLEQRTEAANISQPQKHER